jgi:hypothetical protein
MKKSLKLEMTSPVNEELGGFPIRYSTYFFQKIKEMKFFVSVEEVNWDVKHTGNKI